ncbi:MAG: hypothetical protein A2Z72_08995 [Omnitrophica bacterium RBG_13_46_9]|nr:MAG: hypothetical protein A2Z72_08995 [Omnitrophica bacterium RBG_13_46_9]
MDFAIMFSRVSPRLRKMAKRLAAYRRNARFFDHTDIYQEMCLSLWNNYRYGVPEDINDAYIIKGCEFHIRNYLRKERVKANVVSLDEPVNEDGDTLKEILPDRRRPLESIVDEQAALRDIRCISNERENKIFTFMLAGHTIREIGKKLNISHVMVIKHKKRAIARLLRNKGYQTRAFFTYL